MAVGMDKQIKLMHKLIIDLVEDARLHKTPMASIIGNGNFVAEQIINNVYNQALDDLAEFFMRDYVCDSICRDDCSQAKLVSTVCDFVEQLQR